MIYIQQAADSMLFSNLKQIFCVSAGVIVYFACIICAFGNVYKGGGIFYRLGQSRNPKFISKIIVSFFESSFSSIIRDYHFMKKNINKQRLSTSALDYMSDESLKGYGDCNFSQGSNDLFKQQRGLILSILLESLQGKQAPGRRYLEVGCGNGDIVSYLSEKFPDALFTGVDFSTKNAEGKHPSRPNLRFISGYALDLISAGDLQCDVFFASSLFCVIPPLELKKYIELLRLSPCSEIIINEPSWYGFKQDQTNRVESFHMGGNAWYHNYAGLLRSAGFKILDFDFKRYQHPTSKRPDLKIVLLRAVRN